MSGNLVDTNAAIFAVTKPEKLTLPARRAILRGPNTVSVVSLWEVILKSMKGTLDVGDPMRWWRDAVHELDATILPLQQEHVAGLLRLPAHHKDPFDRIVIAQATAEGLSLVTSDRAIARYSSSDLKIIW
ncbi:MAG TPA: type II toxin-antitoxin system VapC family toxin [Terracidiphilus sp.]